MKVYFRILKYAPHLASRIVKFLLFSVMGILFSVFNLALAMPMLNVLFSSQQTKEEAPPLPEFSISVDFLTQTFNHYFLNIVNESGPLNALLFICIAIIISVLMTNLF